MISGNLLKAALLGLFMALIFGSCKKDVPENSIPGEGLIDKDSYSLNIGVNEAQAWYKSTVAVGYRDTSEVSELNALNVHPDWFEAKIVQYKGIQEVVMAPFTDSLGWEYEDRVFKRLVIYRGCEGGVEARLLYFVPEAGYYSSSEGAYSSMDFSGITFQIDEEGALGEAGILQNGVFTHRILTTDTIRLASVEVRDLGPVCPRWGPSWLGKLFNGLGGIISDIGEFLGNIFAGINTQSWDFGNGPLYINSTIIQEWGGFFNNTQFGGGLNPNIFNSYFSNQLFNSAPTHQFEQCLDNYEPGQSAPLLLATERFRDDIQSNGALASPWGNHMIQAINLFIQGNASGVAVSFDDILDTYDENHSDGLYYVPLFPNQASRDALVKVFTSMVDKYQTCVNQASENVPYEGEFFFDFHPEEFCACLVHDTKGYTTEDAIVDFFNEYYQLNDENLARFLALERPELIWAAQELLIEFGINDVSLQAIKLSLLAAKAGVLEDPHAPESLAILAQFYEDCCPENPDCCPDSFDGWLDGPEAIRQADELQDEMLLLKQLHPGWGPWRINLQAHYNLVSDTFHFFFGLCGFIEGPGAFCDAADGLFYAIEFDIPNASASLLAALPGGIIVNSTRLLKKAVAVGGKMRRFVWREVGGKVAFSHGSSYRKVWKELDGFYQNLWSDSYIAHHLIPQALWEHPLAQKAARANPEGLPNGVDPFHMNMPANGWPLHTSRHTGNHQVYSDEITAKLDQWLRDNPDATPEQAATALAEWQAMLKNLIGQSSSGPNINNLDLPDIPNP
ncbi:MAG: AHH domain-containing protein [Lewinellaceae bacterium]|nr:AHH domain-containing protein [Lewinellaceae bacterium]